MPGRQPNAERPAPPVLGALLLAWFVFLSMPRVARALRLILWGVPLTTGAVYGVLIVQQILCIGLPTMLFFRLDPLCLGSLRLRARPLPGGAWIALTLGAVFAALAFNGLVSLWYLLLTALKAPVSVASNIPLPANGAELMLALLAIGCVPALCEEFLMRGLLLPALETRGSRFAVLMSGLLFGLLHGQLLALPAHVLLGFLLGLLLVGYGSIWAPVLFHAAYNGFTVLLSYAGTRMADSAPEISSNLSTSAGPLPYLAQILLFTPLAAALLYYPMRASARKHPPPVYLPGGRRLTRVEKLALLLLLLCFLGQYASGMGVSL